MNYQKFTTEDFVADEFFQQWVLQPGESATTFWENWLHQHPEKQETVQEAREILLMLGYQDKKLPHERIAQLRQSVFHQVKQQQKRKVLWQWGRAAAVVAGLAFAFIAVLLINRLPEKVTYATGYGEVREFMLPDSSVITLNANSKLTYEDFWSDNMAREVRIEGEAFFKISQMDTLQLPDDRKRYQSFIVHTDDMDVVVLGTQFNVKTRRETTSVTLNSGKVALKLPNSAGNETITLVPGDKVTYDEALQKLTKSKVDPERYAAWRYNKFIFDKVPLSEVALAIEDHFGIHIIFEDKQLAAQEFVGSVPSDNIEALITAIAKLYNLQVVNKQDTIIFQK